MAVASSEIGIAALELRSEALILIAVVLNTTDLGVLAIELEQRACVMPGLFDDEPVAIDLLCVRERGAMLNFPDLIGLFRRHRMVHVAASLWQR